MCTDVKGHPQIPLKKHACKKLQKIIDKFSPEDIGENPIMLMFHSIPTCPLDVKVKH